VNVDVQGATVEIVIPKNWDDSVRNAVVTFLFRIISLDVWKHITQDNTGHSHSETGIVGPSETISVKDEEF